MLAYACPRLQRYLNETRPVRHEESDRDGHLRGGESAAFRRTRITEAATSVQRCRGRSATRDRGPGEVGPRALRCVVTWRRDLRSPLAGNCQPGETPRTTPRTR